VLRVMTLNIWNILTDWPGRRAEIVAWINRLEPDLISLQEVIESADGTNQARWLAENASADYHVAYAAEKLWGDLGLFGNAVLSRWPIDAEHSMSLAGETGDDDVRRSITHARSVGYDMFATLLNWKFDEGIIRETQVQEVASFVEEHTDSASALPPILAGDFNAEPDSTEIRFLTGTATLGGRSVYYQDAWRVAGARGPGFTWDNRNPYAFTVREPDRRIDYVFVGWRNDAKGRVESARVICDRALTGTFASDHFGLLAEIATD
jgi:endonuclease/exonuclease/phosphatase family metal-dependent hydrolase